MFLHGRKPNNQLTASSSLARCTMKVANYEAVASSSNSNSRSSSCIIIIIITLINNTSNDTII